MIFTAKKVQQKLKTFLPALVISLALTSCETSSTTKSPVEITYQFHSTVTYLSEGTNGTAGTTATYCYFGDWPQTIKKQEVEIDETQSIKMGRNTYYLGSDNNYYAKCTEAPYNPTCTYSDGTSVNKNATYTVNWWLRSPSFENENVVQSIKNDGNAKYKLSVDSEFGAIVPALSISANKI